MWLWGVLGWCLVAVVVAAAHHRIRRMQEVANPEIASFLVRFENELHRSHPDVAFLGMLPGRFVCLLRVSGQETPVPLHDAYRHAEAYPDAFPRMVDRLLRDVTDVALDRIDDLDFAEAAPRLLPQVRSRHWLQQQGCFGDSGLVHRRLNDELVTVYVVDDPNCMVFVCRAHLQRWRKSEVDLHNLAVGNLARLGTAGLAGVAATQEPVLVQSGDGYDAARVLLLEGTEGLLVAIPDRDTLWVGPEGGQNLERLMATTDEIAREAAHPVSPTVFRLTGGQLQAVTVPRGS
jgi:uncharacterized protein YtpQ (UPF0354 family)